MSEHLPLSNGLCRNSVNKIEESSSNSDSDSPMQKIGKQFDEKLYQTLRKNKSKDREQKKMYKILKIERKIAKKGYKKLKKEKEKIKKLLKKKQKIEAKLKKKEVCETFYDIPVPVPDLNLLSKGDESVSKIKAPMTKEEWEAQQSIIRRVHDPETGRHRLIKGSGEILEECVSRERHKEINKAATRGDGLFYQSTILSKAKK